MDFVEQLGLENPLLLFAAAAQAVDPVAQRAIRLPVEHLDDVRGEPTIRLRPRDALIEIHQVTLVDARGG